MESDSSSITGLLILAVVLILLSMIFSASETAFLSINKLRLRLLRNKKNKKAIRAGKLLDKKEKLLNTILVGNNIVNISLSAIITSIALDLFGPAGVGLATAIVTVLLLVFGEITPKSIGTHHPEGIAFLFAPLLKFFTWIFSPIVFILTKVTRFIARLFGVKFSEKKVSFTEEEIKQFIQVGEEEGVLESGEKTMMQRVFKFTDLSAKEIMVPRTKITAIPMDITYRKLIELSQKSHLSRFPVYDKDLDDIKGILYLKDVFCKSFNEKNFNIKEVLRPPLYILETKKMSSIRQMLEENHESMAVVLDEYSGTAGILTTEDITEEIFGSIYDEYDSIDVPEIEKISSTEATLSGSARLIDVNEILGINLESENYETINGYLTELYDGFPENETEIQDDLCVFTILDSTDRKINKVKITKRGEL
ncbi:MAG: HlyC/CorC family transporter [Spirochaetaceae bacterium]|nr:HlyC/CorC family transporter [Spirochaetaceae bacterium]